MSTPDLYSAELASSLAAIKLGDAKNEAIVEESQPPTPDGTGLPANFQVIAPGLYRSSYPQTPHFPELEKLGLKTIITLVPQDLAEDYTTFMAKNGIKHHHIPVMANKDPEIYTPDAVMTTIHEIMLDSNNYPLLVHCNKGKHRTGCVTATFRRITGWTLDASVREYERYSAPKDRALDKIFINRFDASSLKSVAIERGYVGGIWRQPAFGSTNYSTYTTSTVDTNYTTTDDSTTDRLERVLTEADSLEGAKAHIDNVVTQL
jgi:tyrosine-protein phosphatase SIW14